MFVIVANKIGRRQLGRSEPGGDERPPAVGERALDGVAGHDRIVDEQPEREDERRN